MSDGSGCTKSSGFGNQPSASAVAPSAVSRLSTAALAFLARRIAYLRAPSPSRQSCTARSSNSTHVMVSASASHISSTMASALGIRLPHEGFAVINLGERLPQVERSLLFEVGYLGQHPPVLGVSLYRPLAHVLLDSGYLVG